MRSVGLSNSTATVCGHDVVKEWSKIKPLFGYVPDRAGVRLRPEAAAPHEEGVDAVRERRPQRHEDQPDLEVDPADHTAEEQQGCDGGEDELEVGQRALGEPELRHGSVK